jgi:sec-independent protein translocase protein TatA
VGGMSLIHWLVVGLIVLLLFGRGRLPALMTDVAKGIKSFRAGMREDDEAAPPSPAPPAPQATVPPPAAATPTSEDHKTKV